MKILTILNSIAILYLFWHRFYGEFFFINLERTWHKEIPIGIEIWWGNKYCKSCYTRILYIPFWKYSWVEEE